MSNGQPNPTNQAKQSAAGPQPSKANPYAVSSIPPFKGATGAVNYAAAASKSSSSNAARQPAVTVNGQQQNQTSQAASTPTAQPKPIRDPNHVAFGNVNDSSAVLSSSPAAPPAFNGSTPKAFGSVPAVSAAQQTEAPKSKLDLHSFFTGGGPSSGNSPAPTPSPVPSSGGPDRRSLATFDPQGANSATRRSPQPTPAQLSNSTSSFAPRAQPFVPQAFSPSPTPGHFPHMAPPHSPFMPGANGSAASFTPGSQPQRNGNPPYANSPIMQQQRPSPATPSRPSFSGPTSPRMQNMPLHTPNPMMYGQWSGQAYGGQYYYPGMPYQQGQFPQGAPSPNPPVSGATTPSGLRSPSISAPSPSPSLNVSSPVYQPFSPSGQPSSGSASPLPMAAMQPRNFSMSAVAGVQEFRPTVSLGPRKSAAIPIRRPDEKKDVKKDDASAVKKDEAGKTEDAVKDDSSKDEQSKTSSDVPKSAAVKIEDPKKVSESSTTAEAPKPAEQDKSADDAQKKAEEAEAKAKAEEAKAKAEAARAKAAAEAEAAEKVKREAEEKAAIEKRAQEEKAAEEKKKADEQEKAAAAVAAAAKAESSPSQDDKPVESSANASVADAQPDVEAKKPESVKGEPATKSDDDSQKAKDEPESPPVASTSALQTAKPIEDLKAVSYPDNIKSPSAELNTAAAPGKYRYDREFLMQFMSVCTEKPDALPNLEAIGMLEGGGDGGRGGGGFGGGRRGGPMGPPAVPGGRGGAPGFGRQPSASGFAGMGNFGAGANLGSSEARFAASTANMRTTSFGGGRREHPMSRGNSQTGITVGSGFMPAGRVKSARGEKRGGKGGQQQHVAGQGLEDVAPLELSENRWMPSFQNKQSAPEDSPEMVQRKVKALLNKLTLERFDSISKQILEWANKSVNEDDGRILRQVIALIFEKATDEANWSEMYARLCRFLMEKLSPDVKDLSVKNAEGKPVAGGALFRKYLLNRCQEDYESGWKHREVAAAAAASKAAEDSAKQAANEAAKKEAEEAAASGKQTEEKEAELLSDEYYAAQKAKRRGLGLVRFIGELYRLQMLTERIMHECIKKLLANVDSPEEEDVESLCRLMTTVGKGLDTAKAKGHMDVYFTRMGTIESNEKLASRIRFMIKDVIELRQRRWEPRHGEAGPKLLSEIHQDATKEAEAKSRAASSGGRGMPRLQDQLSRPGSKRGQGRDGFGVPQTGPDGWTTPVAQRPAKAGDLSGFGRIRDQQPVSLGPSGAFANRANKAKETQQRGPSNPFALLGAETTSERPKLNLAPRSVPVEGEGGEEGEGAADQAGGEEEDAAEDDGQIDPNAVSMSRAEAERRSDNSVKEFFSVRNISEGVASVEALPAEYRGILLSALANEAVQKKADDVNITKQLFSDVLSKEVVPRSVMLESLTSLVKGTVDLAVDVPSVYQYTATLLVGASVTKDEVQEMASKMESEFEDEEEVEHGRESLMAAFDSKNQQ